MAQLTELRHNSQIMPKQIPQDELDAILEAVTQFPEGASVENLSQTLGKKLPRVLYSAAWHDSSSRNGWLLRGGAGAAATGSQKL